MCREETTKARRLAVWSGPRNISTAMMRAWEQRPDCVVWDEPFYAAWLLATGADHPMREAVIAAGEREWDRVVERCAAPPPGGAAIHYQKHMSHHLLPGRTLDWVDALSNIFLIRDPARVVRSYVDRHEQIDLAAIGVVQQWQLFERLADHTGRAPLVIDSGEFLARPEAGLRRMCAEIGVKFDPGMLHWPAGPRVSDGAWAPHWYASVWRSTGFAPPPGDDAPIPPHPVAEAAMPWFERLFEQRATF